MSSNLAPPPKTETDQVTPWYLIGALTLVMIWTFWNTIDGLIGIWRNPQYSHGYLVPIFTIALLVMRRQPFQPVSFFARWSGVAIIAGGLAMRLLGAYIHNGVVEMWAIIPVLMGIFTVAGGWSMLRWAAAPLAFLIFMMPVPEHVADMFLAPLQQAATVFSSYTLQTLGVDSYYIGNRIIIGEGFPLNIEEQCSGLRMCTIFLAMAVAMTMITERPWWQNVDHHFQRHSDRLVGQSDTHRAYRPVVFNAGAGVGNRQAFFPRSGRLVHDAAGVFVPVFGNANP